MLTECFWGLGRRQLIKKSFFILTPDNSIRFEAALVRHNSIFCQIKKKEKNEFKVLSFVLSRQIINIYNDIARKYGNVTVKNFHIIWMSEIHC